MTYNEWSKNEKRSVAGANITIAEADEKASRRQETQDEDES